MPAEPLVLAHDGRQIHLRTWQRSDAAALVDAWCDDQVAAFNGVPPDPTLAVAEHWIAGVPARLDKRLSLDLVIEVEQVGVVGEIGFSGFSQDGSAALVGYWLLPHARGQGIAGAALEHSIGWARREFGLTLFVARCAVDNVASQQVAKRCGFQHEAHDPQGFQLWRKRLQ